MIEITPYLSLRDEDVTERMVKASGPGGQHVNKTSNAVELRFDVRASTLADDVKSRLEKLAGSRLTQDGVLILFAQGSRSLEMNRQEVRERLADQYDWFVLTRADHVHLCRHPPLSQLTSSGMWVPTKEHWNGWTDRHLVATATNFVRALNMTSEILCNPAAWRERMKDMDFINIEVLQKLAWDHNGLHVNQFPRTMFTVRAENDSSKWSQGCNDDDMHNFCLKIKYPEAKREALKTCANLIPGFDVREALSALVSPRVACGGHKPAPVEPDTWCPSGA